MFKNIKVRYFWVGLVAYFAIQLIMKSVGSDKAILELALMSTVVLSVFVWEQKKRRSAKKK